MKRKFLMILALGVVSTGIFTSCAKDDLNVGENLLASKVIGTYAGTMKNSLTNEVTPATIDVTLVNDSLVQMHCTTVNFDSTVMLQLYQDNDSIMACYSGQDFYNEYGHTTNMNDYCNSQQSGTGMGMGMGMGMMNNNRNGQGWSGSNQSTAWTNHMNTQHDQNDVHYGGFNVSDNSCNYRFLIDNGDSGYFDIFSGVRKKK